MVLGLGPAVEAPGEDRATPRPPWSDRLPRESGGPSGQALTTAADPATVFAAATARGGFAPMTTVRQPASFQRVVTGSDVPIEAVPTGPDRRMAFAGITMRDQRPGPPATRADAVRALPDGPHRHGPRPVIHDPSWTRTGILASGNLHIEYPSGSRDAADLHNRAPLAAPLARSAGFADGQATRPAGAKSCGL
ncbi:hypothetical protein AB0M11_36700 [Streptomyces sp. NPDC051987]|uniref:hypothetical protein n=1 Tax=Streptomyces sp. NPDC051987 TaxID=3155808 RepID=UPI00341CFE87